jgi:hypothetical protein
VKNKIYVFQPLFKVNLQESGVLTGRKLWVSISCNFSKADIFFRTQLTSDDDILFMHILQFPVNNYIEVLFALK